MKYDKTKISSAIRFVAEETRKGNSIVLYKIPTLNSLSCGYFKQAMTRSFNKKNHGFDLEPIYSIQPDGKWKMNEFTKNPKDDTLVDLVIKAMEYVGKNVRNVRDIKRSEFVCEDLKVPTDEELIKELKKRGYTVFKAM